MDRPWVGAAGILNRVNLLIDYASDFDSAVPRHEF